MIGNWIKKDESNVLTLKEYETLSYLSFPILEKTGMVRHGFSTKHGGVSEGDFATMNFSFNRGDRAEHVLENYRRIAAALDQDINKMVVSYQTHTTNVRTITEEDMGKGVVRERDYKDVDGLITNIPNIMLVTFYADCVPLYFVDPVKRAIGLSHSGWRGTVGKMGKVTVECMKQEYGTNPKDLIVCIGPSICKSCYEVGQEVADEFQKLFDQKKSLQILEDKGNGKYQLDLWKANELILMEAGVLREHIAITNTCTNCNPDLLFSHRRTGTHRGNLAAFLALKKETD